MAKVWTPNGVRYWDTASTIAALSAASTLAQMDAALASFGTAYGLDIEFPATGDNGAGILWTGVAESDIVTARAAAAATVEEFAKYPPEAVLASDLALIRLTGSLFIQDPVDNIPAAGLWLGNEQAMYVDVTIDVIVTRNIVNHEFAHCIEDSSPIWNDSLKATFASLNPYPYPQKPAFSGLRPAGYVTDYARTNVREDFAETHCQQISNVVGATYQGFAVSDPVVAHKTAIVRSVFASVHSSLGGTAFYAEAISPPPVSAGPLSLSAVAQPDTWPPSVRLTLTNGQAWPAVRFRRYVGSAMSDVHTTNGQPVPVSGGTATLVDYWAPYGEWVTYQAVDAASGGLLAASQPIQVSADDPWLVHVGFPARSVPLVLRAGSFQSRTRGTTRTTLRPLGRRLPLVVSGGVRPSHESSMIVQTATSQELSALDTLLADDSVLLLNIPRDTGLLFPTCYVSVGDAEEVRLTDIGEDVERDWRLPFLVTSAPIPGTGISTGPDPDGGWDPGGGGENPGGGGRTYADEAVAHNTYQAAKVAHATFADAFNGED